MSDAIPLPSRETIERASADLRRKQTSRRRDNSNLQAAIDGAQLLDDVSAFLCRFVAYPSPQAAIAHTLWIAHTHAMDAWESTPRIAFLSPEPGSGKTRALELTETLVPNPCEAVNVSAAYLFRKVAEAPTILFDEIDTVFGPRAGEHEDVRGLLNAGHRRGAMAGRCVVRGKNVETEELPAYCAVALAGLGNLPDTILTRSVIVKMRRRAPSERVEPYRRRENAAEGNALRDQLVEWALQHDLENARPEMPAGIEDRNADVWEPLLAIADAAGEDWPTIARVAAVALVADPIGDRGSLGVRLLSDLRNVFGDRDSLSTKHIIERLVEIEEAPWGDLRGKPIDSRRLAGMLRQYSISSLNIRDEMDRVVKGYTREALHDSWIRYLPSVADKEDRSKESSARFSDTSNGLSRSRVASATSATSATSAACLRCGGEGCEWCQPGGGDAR